MGGQHTPAAGLLPGTGAIPVPGEHRGERLEGRLGPMAADRREQAWAASEGARWVCVGRL